MNQLFSAFEKFGLPATIDKTREFVTVAKMSPETIAKLVDKDSFEVDAWLNKTTERKDVGRALLKVLRQVVKTIPVRVYIVINDVVFHHTLAGTIEDLKETISNHLDIGCKMFELGFYRTCSEKSEIKIDLQNTQELKAAKLIVFKPPFKTVIETPLDDFIYLIEIPKFQDKYIVVVGSEKKSKTSECSIQ